MTRALFGTDGVRGLAGTYPLDQAGAQRIGAAVGALFAQPGQQVVIAADPRESSAMLVAALTAGLVSQGVAVVDVGVLPTPGLAYLTRNTEAFVAGVMITASHNTYEYNGVKVFDQSGDKLTDEREVRLNELIDNPPAPRGEGTRSEDLQAKQAYQKFLHAAADDADLSSFKVGLDMANGAASGLAHAVLDELGLHVEALFESPDGRNINAGCGATDTTALQKVVIEKRLDLGIALDGDADRLIMIDGLGREVKGDYIMYILAVSGKLDGVVATVMSNFGFEQALESKHIALTRTAVGDRYVLEGLEETGFQLGGEQSGHIIVPSLLKTGDGMLAAILTLRALHESGRSLADWCNEVTLLPQSLVNISLADKQLLDVPSVHDYIEAESEKLGSRGRLLIRPSGTEPLARVMVEAPDAEAEAQRIAQDLQELIRVSELSA